MVSRGEQIERRMQGVRCVFNSAAGKLADELERRYLSRFWAWARCCPTGVGYPALNVVLGADHENRPPARK